MLRTSDRQNAPVVRQDLAAPDIVSPVVLNSVSRRWREAVRTVQQPLLAVVYREVVVRGASRLGSWGLFLLAIRPLPSSTSNPLCAMFFPTCFVLPRTDVLAAEILR